ncbi:hypothetical protein O181_051939 [Austropuccinia psidii MF-1]|uniref:Uncharacterized protein n=1 Tax=Austropuccinia psidii MF-1 TaxID=1389203 RepID=A0A9Q3DZP4_9BASI|nr:hypothetical protein [Austropuccinia psidii MF-1]
MVTILWAFAMVSNHMTRMHSIVDVVVDNLHSAALTYGRTTGHGLSVLELLTPLRKSGNDIEYYLLVGSRTYAIVGIILTIFLFPTAYTCNKYLFNSSTNEIDSQSIVDPCEQTFQIRRARNLRWQQRQLYRLTLFVFLTQFIHLPCVLWQLTHASEGFCLNVTWARLTEHGLNLPFAILGNVNLYFLNVHSRALTQWLHIKAEEQILVGPSVS